MVRAERAEAVHAPARSREEQIAVALEAVATAFYATPHTLAERVVDALSARFEITTRAER